MSHPAVPDDAPILRALDRGLEVQHGTIAGYVNRLHAKRPDAPPAHILGRLERTYRVTLTTSGAAAGAAAAAPGVGTLAATAISGGSMASFYTTTTSFVLAVATVHGLTVEDIERRRALLRTIMLGERGTEMVEEFAGRTGSRWGRQIVTSIPMGAIRHLNRILGRELIRKQGRRQGALVLGRVIPFGVGAAIGAGGNAVIARNVITATRQSFGNPPHNWDPPVQQHPQPPADPPGPIYLGTAQPPS